MYPKQFLVLYFWGRQGCGRPGSTAAERIKKTEFPGLYVLGDIFYILPVHFLSPRANTTDKMF